MMPEAGMDEAKNFLEWGDQFRFFLCDLFVLFFSIIIECFCFLREFCGLSSN